MDIGTLRGIFTVLIFVIFVVIVLWAYSKNRKQDFDNVAKSILDDDSTEQQNKQETKNNV